MAGGAPFRGIAARRDRAFDGVAVDAARVSGAPRAETELVCAQLCIRNRHRIGAGFQRALRHLELLLQG